jgi:putative restriction endonuclease
MRYWWVNHNQTFRQELAGNYLWSPTTEAHGARSRFYDNMRAASPGDIVLSYSGALVRRVGVIADFAIASPKPSEFGSAGAYWKNAGWLLPVEWQEPEMAVSPKGIIASLADALPRTHSPIRSSTGSGNQKAYLAEVGRDVVRIVLTAGGLDLAAFEAARPTITIEDFRTQAEDALDKEIQMDLSLDATAREQLSVARRGQGLFRRRVMSVEPVCRVTGLTDPSLLLASHVKPWRSCESGNERLDGFNGLMLAPHADFLFDRGLIGFEDDGQIRWSSRIADGDWIRLGLRESQRPPAKPLHPKSRDYFGYHRSQVFLA